MANPASRIDVDDWRQRYNWEVETLRENVALLVMNGKEPDKKAFLSAKVMIDAAGMYQGASLSVHGASQSGFGALLLALTEKGPVKVAVVVTGAGEMALGSLIAGTSGLRLVDNLQEMNSGGEGDSETADNNYKAPEGGGGVTDKIKVGNKEAIFGHGGRHLEGTNLFASEVNQAIAKDVITKNPGTGQFYKGQVNVNGVNIEYTSYGVKDGVINIGTYYPK